MGGKTNNWSMFLRFSSPYLYGPLVEYLKKKKVESHSVNVEDEPKKKKKKGGSHAAAPLWKEG